MRDLGARVDQMQRLDSLGQLAGGIAHDFNNVLGIIAGFTELVRDELPDGSPWPTRSPRQSTRARR